MPGTLAISPQQMKCEHPSAAWLAQLLCGRSRVRAPDRTNTQGPKITEENVLPL